MMTIRYAAGSSARVIVIRHRQTPGASPDTSAYAGRIGRRTAMEARVRLLMSSRGRDDPPSDDLVGTPEDRRRDGQPERLTRPRIDDELESGGALDRKGLGARLQPLEEWPEEWPGGRAGGGPRADRCAGLSAIARER